MSFKLEQAVEKSAKLTTQIVFQSGAKGVPLLVEIRYMPPGALQKKEQSIRATVARRQQSSGYSFETDDVYSELAELLADVYASAVNNICISDEKKSPVKVKDLVGYLPFKKEFLEKHGDEVVNFNRDGQDSKTAAENIAMLAKGCTQFVEFLEASVKDVGLFQTADVKAELGNSQAGTDTKSA